MTKIYIEYLGGPQIEQLKLTNQEILDAVENALIAAGKGETVIKPRLHLKPNSKIDGHFNILKRYVAPLKYAGAKWLAPKNPKILSHIGARGTAYWNVRLLDHIFDFDEIRIHSRRTISRNSFAATLSQDLGKIIIATENWQDCLDSADIMVEASR